MESEPWHTESAVASSSGVRIRPYRDDDVSALHEAVQRSTKALSAWLVWAQGGCDRTDVRAWVASRTEAWQAGDAYSFVVEATSDGRFLGGVGLNQVRTTVRMANLGYWVRTDATGNGIATTAARLAADFGFSELGLQRIELPVPVGNAAGARVAEKLGARREGVLRNRLRLHGEPVGAVLYGLLPSDL